MTKRLLRPVLVIAILLCVILSVINYDKKFNTLAENIDTYSENTYDFTCHICNYPIVDDDIIKVYADVKRSDFPLKLNGRKLLLKLHITDSDIAKYGYTLKLKGSIESASPSLNKGSFSYRQYLESENTIAIFDATGGGQVECTDKGSGMANKIYTFRTNVIDNLKKHFSGDDAALMIAMLTGDRSSLSDEMNLAYKSSGIYHIVSVSGLHAGIFISIISFFLLSIPIRTKRKKLITKLMAVLISIALYVFTGFGISITRVILMMALMFASIMLRREYNILISIVAAAALILIIMPWQFFNQSFQLSFLSTFGMCLGLKIFKDKIPDNKWGKYLITPLIISMGATLFTLHVSVYNFRMVSLMGLVSNLVAVPLSTMLLIFAIGFSALSTFLPPSIMAFLKFIPYIPAKLINTLADIVSKFEYAYIKISPTDFFELSVWIAWICLMCFCFIKKRKTSAVITALIIVVNCWIMMYNENNTQTKVTFINAGKGESTLIQTADRKTVLIDCGSRSGKSPAEDVFIPYFDHNGIKKVDKLFVSYFDDEHTNAINILMREGYVGELILPNQTNLTRENVQLNKLKMIDAAKKFNVKFSHINYGDSIAVADRVSINLREGNENLKDKNSAAVYIINCNKISFMLSSCLGAKGQQLYADMPTSCSVLKIPSYGGMTKSTKSYILSANPQYAVVTFPSKDKFLNFDPNIEDTLKSSGISYARTDENQTITFITDGEKINSVNLRKGELK